MDDIDRIGARAIQQAATDLTRARRHAISLERIAVAVLVFGAASSLVLVAADVAMLWPAAGTLLAAASGWGVLRALAMVLHLRVDDTMVELGADRDATPA